MTALTPEQEAQMRKAVAAHQGGDYKTAEAAYHNLLQQLPDFVDALHLHGVVLSQLGHHERAGAALRKAVERQPNHPVFQHNLGRALLAMGDNAAAIQHFERALNLNPGFTEARFNLANALKNSHQLKAAEAHLKQVLRQQPNHAAAHYNLGNIYIQRGLYNSALRCLEQATRLLPNYPEALNNLGIAQNELGDHERAEAAYRKALDLRPDYIDALRNLGQSLDKQGEFDRATEYLERVMALTPDDRLFRLQVENRCPLIPQSNAQIDGWREQLKARLAEAQWPAIELEQLRSSGVEPPFVMAYQGRDDRPLKEAFATLVADKLPHLPAASSSAAPRSRPRVGFVVTHGHEGVFIKCMRGMLNQFPHDRFEVFVVCELESGEGILRDATNNPAIQFLQLPSAFDQALQKLYAACFDLLYYWEVGTDTSNYYLPFFKPAPVQCAGWGWPVTTGIPQVDYFVSSEYIEPDNAEDHYSEQLVRLPSLPTYYYRPSLPEEDRVDRQALGLDETGHYYLVIQNVRKIHPDMDALFAKILARDEKGQLLIIGDQAPAITAQLRQRLERSMGDHIERLTILPRLDEQHYLSLISHVDVVLDTLHYSGGANTSYDCFACGTPVVTLPTEFHRGRYTAAAYRRMQIQDCIAANTKSYVDIAVHLASDREARQDLSKRITNASPMLFEDQAAVDELADFFQQAIQGQ